MQPGRTTNTGSRTMEVVAAAPRCQLLLIVLMAAMLLPGMKGSPLLVWRKIAKTIKLQGSIGKGDETWQPGQGDLVTMAGAACLCQSDLQHDCGFLWLLIMRRMALDLCYSSVITPKMLVSFTKLNIISYDECMTQSFFFCFFVIDECYFLTAMAYNRYDAI
ncbi:hypothetical protein STEG23_028594, partial [Scotinomys teguina]